MTNVIQPTSLNRQVLRMIAMVLAGACLVLLYTHRLFDLKGYDGSNFGLRESQTAMVTRNLVSSGPDAILTYLNFPGVAPVLTIVEAPVFNHLVRALHSLTGSSDPTLGRWAAWLSFLPSIGYLWWLFFQLRGVPFAHVATALFALIPGNQLFAQNYRADVLVFTLIYASIAHFYRYSCGRRGVHHLVAAILFATLAAPLKMSPVFVLMASFMGINCQRLSQGQLQPAAWLRRLLPGFIRSAVFLLPPVAAFGIWALFAHSVNATDTESYLAGQLDGFVLGSWRDRFDLSGYTQLLKQLTRVVSPGVVVLAVYGLFADFKNGISSWLSWLYLAAGVVTYALFWRISVENLHYGLIFALPAAYFGAVGWNALATSARLGKGTILFGLVVAQLAFCLTNSLILADSFVKRPEQLVAYQAGNAYRQGLVVGQPVIFCPNLMDTRWDLADGTFFFFSNANGLKVPNMCELARLDRRLSLLGYHHLVVGTENTECNLPSRWNTLLLSTPTFSVYESQPKKPTHPDSRTSEP